MDMCRKDACLRDGNNLVAASALGVLSPQDRAQGLSFMRNALELCG